jgi:RNA polymerase sigma factor (sigma-70 family)
MHDLEAAIRAAFDDIDRQLETYKAGLRRERFWKPISRRREFRRMNTTVPPAQPGRPGAFFSRVSPHLEKLSHFAGHVISFAEANGDLEPGELTAEEAVGAALVRAWEQFEKEPARGEIQAWLIWLAAGEIGTEIERLKHERRHIVYIDEMLPKTLPREEFTPADEILYFYQPGEDLNLEDAVPGLEIPAPEKEAEAAEVHRCVKSALDSMPRDQRRVLLLHFVQELPLEDLAGLVGNPVAQVERTLEEARGYLHQKLTESGCSFHEVLSAKDEH